MTKFALLPLTRNFY